MNTRRAIFAALAAAVLMAASAHAEGGPAEGAPSGDGLSNPLWALPLDALSATRERPLFSPSRRPDASVAVVTTGAETKIVAVSGEAPFTLIGTVVGEPNIAVLVDKASNETVRLREGAEHGGWTLVSVLARAATFEREGAELQIVLPPSLSPLDGAPPPETR